MSNPYTTSAPTSPLAEYIIQIQEFSDDKSQALALVQETRDHVRDEAEANLLSGEEAFYKEKYKAALKFYLSAQTVPNFHFFCFRASAFVSKELGRTAKAVGYARKALKIYPNDPITVNLLSNLLESYSESEEAEEIRNRLDSPLESEELENARPFAIAEEELSELSDLFSDEVSEPEPLDEAEEKTHFAMETLDSIADSDYQVDTEPTDRFLSSSLGVDLESGQTLEARIKRFQREKVDAMSHYVETSLGKANSTGSFLQVLNGWNDQNTQSAAAQLSQQLLPSAYRRTSGGYFLRWNGKGVVINPGPSFLKNFHEAGHHIKEIDTVVVTRDNRESHVDVKAIYDLNYGLNKMAADLHVIHYYLNQQAHRTLANQLKPHFKQERNTVFCLELYVDSPEIESIALSEDISLHYFPTNSSDGAIGIKLELQNSDLVHSTPDGRSRVTLGYISGAPYSPLLAHHLSGTDVLIAGFEGTSANDYGKLKYNDESLGFFGTFSLVEEVAPSVLLFAEFNGREGDIRAEVAHKLKQEYAYSAHHSTAIFPADTGMTANLETLKVKCSLSGDEIEPSQVRVVKEKDAFGRLRYLGPNSIV